MWPSSIKNGLWRFVCFSGIWTRHLQCREQSLYQLGHTALHNFFSLAKPRTKKKNFWKSLSFKGERRKDFKNGCCSDKCKSRILVEFKVFSNFFSMRLFRNIAKQVCIGNLITWYYLTAHLGCRSNSEIFKVATNILFSTQYRTRHLLASVALLIPTELRHLNKTSSNEKEEK